MPTNNRPRITSRSASTVLALGLLCQGGLATPAWAETSAYRPLTLAEAVSLARTHSLAAQANREHLASTLEQRSVTQAAALPSLSYGASANYSVLPSGSNGVGNGLSGYPAPGTYIDSSLNANQVIFDAFSTRDALALADLQADINRLSIDQAEQDAMRDAAVDFLQTLRAKGLAEVAADAVSQAQEHLRLAQSKQRAGSGTRGDVLQLEAQLANAEASYMQAQNSVTLAYLTLSNALNAPIDDRPLAPNAIVPILVARPGDELAVGLTKRQEVQQAELKVISDKTRVDNAKRTQWPTLSGSSRYSQRNLQQGNFLAGVNLNWPLYEGDRARHQMESARHDAAADQASLEQTRQAIALDIRTQYQLQQEAIARVATTRRGLTASQEAYHIALSRYSAGLSTLYELVDVQTTLTQARGNFVQATVDQSVASVKLARALGQDVAGFLGVQK